MTASEERVVPLIDGDILTYQAAFGGQDRETGEVLSFNYVSALIDKAIAEICFAVDATELPIVFLTGDSNFRDEVAITKPYKGNRDKPRPFHYANARAYLMSLPNSIMTDGIEADDAMSIYQTQHLEDKSTVICTRDKDLRMVPGWHYGWEHHSQPEFFKRWIDDLGYLEFDEEKCKISGGGFLFFCSQLVTGDKVDNIPGLPKKGDKAAWDLLRFATSKDLAMELVIALYQQVMGDSWREYLLEQGRLLWMVRELDEEGKPIMWEIPE